MLADCLSPRVVGAHLFRGGRGRGGGDQKDNHLRSYKFTMLVAADTDGLEHLAGDKDKRAALLLDKVL